MTEEETPKIAVVIGHDIRAWTTYELEDTPELRAVLNGDEDLALATLRPLVENGTAKFITRDHEEGPDEFDEYANTAIADVTYYL